MSQPARSADAHVPVTEIPADPADIRRDPDDQAVQPGALLLELVPVPVTDIDRARDFYRDRVGFRLDVDVAPAPGVRIVQLTPPRSACSIVLAEGVPALSASPGSLRGLHLVVADMAAARATLLAGGVSVGEVEDVGGGVLMAFFADPDGNTWCLQHMPWR